MVYLVDGAAFDVCVFTMLVILLDSVSARQTW